MSDWYPAVEIDLNSPNPAGRLIKARTDQPHVGDVVVAYESEDQIGTLMTVAKVIDDATKDYWMLVLDRNNT